MIVSNINLNINTNELKERTIYRVIVIITYKKSFTQNIDCGYDLKFKVESLNTYRFKYLYCPLKILSVDDLDRIINESQFERLKEWEFEDKEEAYNYSLSLQKLWKQYKLTKMLEYGNDRT